MTRPFDDADSSGQVAPRFHRSVLSNDVYAHLRVEIMEGRIGPGTRIVEERLARDLGMSRTPLREAIPDLLT